MLLVRAAVDAYISGLYWLGQPDAGTRLTNANAKSAKQLLAVIMDLLGVPDAGLDEAARLIGEPADLPKLHGMAQQVADQSGVPLTKVMYARELPDHVVSVWGTKRRASRSVVRLEPAEPAHPGPEWQCFIVPRSPGSDRAWKSAVHEAVRTAAELPDGPVALLLAFTVGAGRRWPSIWKASIDALDRLLGRTYPERDWNPQDGRIVRLGLHKIVNPDWATTSSWPFTLVRLTKPGQNSRSWRRWTRISAKTSVRSTRANCGLSLSDKPR